MPCPIHFRLSHSLSPMPLYCFLVINNCVLVHFSCIHCLSLLLLLSPMPLPSNAAAAVFIRCRCLPSFTTAAGLVVAVISHHCCHCRHCLLNILVIILPGSSSSLGSAVPPTGPPYPNNGTPPLRQQRNCLTNSFIINIIYNRGGTNHACLQRRLEADAA